MLVDKGKTDSAVVFFGLFLLGLFTAAAFSDDLASIRMDLLLWALLPGLGCPAVAVVGVPVVLAMLPVVADLTGFLVGI